MHGFGFATLALVTAIGFAGPLLAAVPRLRIPVVIGELLAGLVVGHSGFGIIDVGNETLQLIANIGFALVMFVVGTQIPGRGLQMRSAFPLAGARAAWWAPSLRLSVWCSPTSSTTATRRSTRC